MEAGLKTHETGILTHGTRGNVLTPIDNVLSVLNVNVFIQTFQSSHNQIYSSRLINIRYSSARTFIKHATFLKVSFIRSYFERKEKNQSSGNRGNKKPQQTVINKKIISSVN